MLLFLPMIAAHRWNELELYSIGAFTFIAFSMCASFVYILNDLFDLNHDRNHPNKFLRPIASGAISPKHALIIGIFFLVFGLVTAFLVSVKVFLVCCGYLALNFAYNFVLKKVIIMDLICLACFYTLRIFLGGVAMGIPISAWMIGFSIFFFMSLTLIKRVTDLEISKDITTSSTKLSYKYSDKNLLTFLGLGSALISLLILALYIQNSAITVLYNKPNLLWILLPTMFYWQMRMWLLTFRENQNEDLITRVLTDKTSYFCLALVLSIIYFAS